MKPAATLIYPSSAVLERILKRLARQPWDGIAQKVGWLASPPTMAIPIPYRTRVRLLVRTERMALSGFAISSLRSLASSAAQQACALSSSCHDSDQ